jgi:PAS domain-containing protein
LIAGTLGRSNNSAPRENDQRVFLVSVWCLLLESARETKENQIGDYRWFLFRVEPVRDNHGGILKWYGANIDIEDRKRAGPHSAVN